MGPDPEHGARKAKVFLSWSGEKSRLVARAVSRALETLSDDVEPWLSEDLEPGIAWAEHLVPQIQDSDLAILCLTNRNKTAPWIAFEAGAYYTSPLRFAVIPYLLDLEPAELGFPLGLFQCVKADWTGTKRLFARVAEFLELDESAWEATFATEVWPTLEDQLLAYRDISPEGQRTDEPGNWMNIANAFYLGHDLRWTMGAVEQGMPLGDVRHGLRQILHQADELGLSQHDHFLILARQANGLVDLDPSEWDGDIVESVAEALHDAFERFGGLLIRRQPGYRPYPPDNQGEWLRIQSERRA